MHKEPSAIPLRELCLVLLLGILWGVPFAFTKLALQTIPPVTQAAARASLAAAALWLITPLLARKLPRATPGLLIRLFAQGTLACVIPYTLVAFGQRSVASGLAAVVASTTPLFVYLISIAWTHHERTTLARLSGAFIGLGGVVLVVGSNVLLGLRGQSAAEAAIVLATVSSAFSVIHGRRFADTAPEIAAAGTLTCAAVVLIPMSLLIDQPWRLAPSAGAVAAVSANAFLVTALGFVLYFRLIRTVGSMGTASTSYLKPAVSVLIGCTFLNEPFTWALALGLAAVLVGIGTINDAVTLPNLSAVFRSCGDMYRTSLRSILMSMNSATGDDHSGFALGKSPQEPTIQLGRRMPPE